MNWISLTTTAQLDELVASSHQQPVLIFKHSTRCIISKMALKNFEAEFPDEVPTLNYFLDLIAYRAISNEIAARFGIEHQSPQLLVIKEGKVIFHESHEGIDAAVLKQYV